MTHSKIITVNLTWCQYHSRIKRNPIWLFEKQKQSQFEINFGPVGINRLKIYERDINYIYLVNLNKTLKNTFAKLQIHWITFKIK